jgi:Zn ribbon nucleic-acid-binding protein
MSVYRARTNCPACNNEEEVWFYKGKVEPLEIVECPNCEHMFEPHSFVSTFLEMKNNLTVSSSQVIV